MRYWQNKVKEAPPVVVAYPRPAPGRALQPRNTPGFVCCQADPFGCPNCATHWLLDAGQRRTPACSPHAWKLALKGIECQVFE